MTKLQERIGQEVIAYLSPAGRAARLARSMMADNATSGRDAVFAAFASSALREIPQIDAVYRGDGEGNFLMVQRGAEGSTDTELIRNAPGIRTVEWVQRDADGRVTEHRLDPDETYDPRKRDWYKGALQSDDIFWTGVDIFFSKRRRLPGRRGALHASRTECCRTRRHDVGANLAAPNGATGAGWRIPRGSTERLGFAEQLFGVIG